MQSNDWLPRQFGTNTSGTLLNLMTTFTKEYSQLHFLLEIMPDDVERLPRVHNDADLNARSLGNTAGSGRASLYFGSNNFPQSTLKSTFALNTHITNKKKIGSSSVSQQGQGENLDCLHRTTKPHPPPLTWCRSTWHDTVTLTYLWRKQSVTAPRVEKKNLAIVSGYTKHTDLNKTGNCSEW
nr:hypothetical protein BgiMline_007898 [Biomphalaria glabrata]